MRKAAAAVRPPLRRALCRSVVAGGLGVALATLAVASGTTTPLARPPLELIKWTGGGAGTAQALAQSVPQPAAPTAVVNGQSVTVSWAATTMSGGSAVPGYIVRRFDQSGVGQTILSNCSGTIVATSCVEGSVPSGQWRYTVQGVVGTAWDGPQSALSGAVTVSAATLVFTSSTTITTLPATLLGTISNFPALASLSYRLDSATGPVLTGSTPNTAALLGPTSISVVIPAGTSDAPHSVFVVGTLVGPATVAAAAVNIVIPPVLQTLVMKDTTGNGKVDQVLATFNDTLAPYSAGVASWTLANVPSGGTLQAVTTSGAVATLTLAEGSSAASTAAGSFTVALTANSAGIRDIYDHPSSFAATPVADAAAPAPISLVMQDVNANGKVDRLVATFSEALATPYSPGTSPWTLASVPSAGTLGTVSVSGATATITIGEGGGALDTAVGAFTVALASNASGVRDAAGNLSSFAARAPSDGAVPVRTGLDMLDANSNGKVDRVTATFSETLAPTTNTAPWVLTAAPSSATLNSVSASGTAATLVLNEGTGAASTAVGTFTVALTASATGVRDAAGNQASFAAAGPADKAPPAVTALTLLDANADGKVDRVTATFSETLATYSAGLAPWTLANVPSSGTLSAVSVTSPTVTLTLAPGAALDTAVGTMTVALAASATGVRDAAGNLTSFTAMSPIDGAKPITVLIGDTNGSTAGRIQAGDTVSFTFSEALNPATVPASTTLSLTDPSGGGNDTLNIAGITSGELRTGSNAYVATNNTVASFAGSTVTLSADKKTITVTVGPACSGTGCASLGTVTNTPSLRFIAATTLTDAAGNAAVGTRTQAIALF